MLNLLGKFFNGVVDCGEVILECQFNVDFTVEEDQIIKGKLITYKANETMNKPI